MIKPADVWTVVDGLGKITREDFTALWIKHKGGEYDMDYLKESAWPRWCQDPLGFIRYWNDGAASSFTMSLWRFGIAKGTQTPERIA